MREMLAPRVRRAYRRRMSDEIDVMDLFDPEAGPELVCRTCGALVSGSDPYPRAHWDWHEASNGA